MPFWLHDHSLVYKARSYSKFQRIIISSMLIGIISIGWYGTLHYYKIKYHAPETTKHYALLHDIQTLKTSLSNQKTQKYGNQNVNQIRSTSYQHHDVVAYLITTMHQHRIICTSIVPIHHTQADEFLKQSTFVMNARGRFDAFISLFKDISNADYLIELYDVMISRSKNNELELKAEVNVRTLVL